MRGCQRRRCKSPQHFWCVFPPTYRSMPAQVRPLGCRSEPPLLCAPYCDPPHPLGGFRVNNFMPGKIKLVTDASWRIPQTSTGCSFLHHPIVGSPLRCAPALTLSLGPLTNSNPVGPLPLLRSTPQPVCSFPLLPLSPSCYFASVICGLPTANGRFVLQSL